MIAARQIISGYSGPIFAIFDRYLFIDDRTGPLIDSSRDVAMATS